MQPTTATTDPLEIQGYSGEYAVRFADRILRKVGYPLITHLKLQKLTFYAYGAVLAERLEPQVGPVEFEAWQHGPVCPSVYERYRAYGAGQLPLPESNDKYAPPVEQCLDDVIAVYGRLSAWQLREQSHLEDPWKRAWGSGSGHIALGDLRSYFAGKFARGSVTLPELLTPVWPLSFDGLPQARFDSLHSLALALS